MYIVFCTLDKGIKHAGRYGRYSTKQNLALEQAFAIHSYPNKSSLQQLKKETLLSEKQILRWLYKKRRKLKLKQCESTQSTG